MTRVKQCLIWLALMPVVLIVLAIASPFLLVFAILSCPILVVGELTGRNHPGHHTMVWTDAYIEIPRSDPLE